MTDRELLELAARAAGIEGKWDDDRCGLEIAVPWRNFMNYETWNPLTDDGDALRLAVKCGIALDRASNRCWTSAAGMAINGVCEEFYKSDPNAATRRAIVRAAAAEIGKEMP